MIDNYNKLSKIVTEHLLSVAYRYMDKKGFDSTFTQEELMEAFKAEGFESRDDLWAKAISNFFDMMKRQATSPHPFNRVIKTDSSALINEAYGDRFSVSKYEFTSDGLIAAEKQLKEIYGDNILSEKPLAEQLGLVEGGTAPASDRIVELDHNSPPYKEAMSALDEVIEAVDNERKNDFEEKERVQKELQAGKTLLSALRVDGEKIKATLIETLKWLGKKFAEKAIDNLVTIAIAAIFTLIGISS